MASLDPTQIAAILGITDDTQKLYLSTSIKAVFSYMRRKKLDFYPSSLASQVLETRGFKSDDLRSIIPIPLCKAGSLSVALKDYRANGVYTVQSYIGNTDYYISSTHSEKPHPIKEIRLFQPIGLPQFLEITAIWGFGSTEEVPDELYLAIINVLAEAMQLYILTTSSFGRGGKHVVRARIKDVDTQFKEMGNKSLSTILADSSDFQAALLNYVDL